MAGTLLIPVFNTNGNKETWLRFLKEHRIRKGEVRGIYVTHHHRDHFGLAGWLQQITGAQVYVSADEVDAINRALRHAEQYVESVAEVYKKLGTPPGLIDQLNEEASQMIAYNDILPELNFIENGEAVQFGQYTFTVLLTPGHTDGHICFYNERQSIVFTGDHLLPDIASSIFLLPGAHPDPLDNYLKSLQVIKDLSCRLLLPGHGNLFTNIPERIEQLNTHHAEMLNVIQNLAGDGIIAYEMCKQIFGQRVSMNRLRFSILEVLAYSMFLVYRGKLVINEGGGISIFSNIYARTTP